jgi:hypothetical protein
LALTLAALSLLTLSLALTLLALLALALTLLALLALTLTLLALLSVAALLALLPLLPLLTLLAIPRLLTLLALLTLLTVAALLTLLTLLTALCSFACALLQRLRLPRRLARALEAILLCVALLAGAKRTFRALDLIAYLLDPFGDLVLGVVDHLLIVAAGDQRLRETDLVRQLRIANSAGGVGKAA